MEDSFRTLDRLRHTEPRVAMVTLVGARDTTPRHPGAKMFVGTGGRRLGESIGGAIDTRVSAEAEQVLAAAAPRLVTMQLTDEEAWEIGFTCGGSVDLLLEPVTFGAPDPVSDAYDRARDEMTAGRPVVLVAPLDGRHGRLLLYSSGNTAGTLGDPAIDEAARVHAMAILGAGHSHVARLEVDCAEVPLYFERLAPPPTLVIFGTGALAEALLAIAGRFGMRVVVVEGRERFARRELLAAASEVLSGPPAEVASRLPLGPHSAVLLVSHDHRHDLAVARHLLQGSAGYIATLGSRRRALELRELLRGEGFSEQQVERLRIPAGVESAVQGAAPVAMSVVSEIVRVMQGRPADGGRARADG
ncbi:MAG: XdhC family protein [Gemmatimonadaceae bacterium]